MKPTTKLKELKDHHVVFFIYNGIWFADELKTYLMKRIIFSGMAIFAVLFASAQSSFTIQTGVNLANVTRSGGDIDEVNMLTSFRAGLIGDFSVAPNFYIQSGLVYTGKGSKIESGEPGTNGYYKQTFSPYYIELPFNLLVKTPASPVGRFFAGGGPYIAMGIRGKTKTEGQTVLGTTYSVESDLRFSNDDPVTFEEEEGSGFGIIKRFDYGLNAVAGLEGKNLVLSLGYGYGLAKIPSGSNQSAGDDNKHRVFSIGLGFKL